MQRRKPCPLDRGSSRNFAPRIGRSAIAQNIGVPATECFHNGSKLRDGVRCDPGHAPALPPLACPGLTAGRHPGVLYRHHARLAYPRGYPATRSRLAHRRRRRDGNRYLGDALRRHARAHAADRDCLRRGYDAPVDGHRDRGVDLRVAYRQPQSSRSRRSGRRGLRDGHRYLRHALRRHGGDRNHAANPLRPTLGGRLVRDRHRRVLCGPRRCILFAPAVRLASLSSRPRGHGHGTRHRGHALCRDGGGAIPGNGREWCGTGKQGLARGLRHHDHVVRARRDAAAVTARGACRCARREIPGVARRGRPDEPGEGRISRDARPRAAQSAGIDLECSSPAAALGVEQCAAAVRRGRDRPTIVAPEPDRRGLARRRACHCGQDFAAAWRDRRVCHGRRDAAGARRRRHHGRPTGGSSRALPPG